MRAESGDNGHSWQVTTLALLFIRYTFLPSPASKIPYHLASIWSFAWLTDLLRYSDSGSTTPVQTPALSTSVITPSFPVTMTRTTWPLAPLRASTHEGDTNSTKLVKSASSFRLSNLTYVDRLIGAPSCVMVRLFSSTEAQSYSITFSSTVHSILGDVSS